MGRGATVTCGRPCTLETKPTQRSHPSAERTVLERVTQVIMVGQIREHRKVRPWLADTLKTCRTTGGRSTNNANRGPGQALNIELVLFGRYHGVVRGRGTCAGPVRDGWRDGDGLQGGDAGRAGMPPGAWARGGTRSHNLPRGDVAVGGNVDRDSRGQRMFSGGRWLVHGRMIDDRLRVGLSSSAQSPGTADRSGHRWVLQFYHWRC